MTSLELALQNFCEEGDDPDADGGADIENDDNDVEFRGYFSDD